MNVRLSDCQIQEYLKKIRRSHLKEETENSPDSPDSRDSLCLYEEKLPNSKLLSIEFAPHNLYISPNTEILIAGICPGQKQAQMAIQAIEQGKTIQDAKKEARFYGQTRTSLLEMLDELDIKKYLHQDAADLMNNINGPLDSIALIPFPVYIDGKNYSGHSPAMAKSQILQDYIHQWFLPAVSRLHHLKLIIPLGKAVEEELDLLKKEGYLKNIDILSGFPHPSPLNSRKKTIFAANKESMQKQLDQCFEESHRIDTKLRAKLDR